MTTLFAAPRPPYPKYKPLQTAQFQSRLYLTWDIQPEAIDAGVPPEIVQALTQSFLIYTVVFLGGPQSNAPTGTWTCLSQSTSIASLTGKISRICASRDPAVLETLFDQTGFDWSQQAQFGLLFALDTDVHSMPPKSIANQIGSELIDGIKGMCGYVRPGDDGDFAELGFLTNQIQSDWLAALRKASAASILELTELS